MTAEMFTFCDYAQEIGGKLVIVSTFDTIITRDFPCVHSQLCMVIRIRFNIGEFCSHSFRIEAQNIDGQRCIEPISGHIEVRSGGNATAVTHLVFSITNLRFPDAGVTNFTLYVDERELSTIPLYVRMDRLDKLG